MNIISKWSQLDLPMNYMWGTKKESRGLQILAYTIGRLGFPFISYEVWKRSRIEWKKIIQFGDIKFDLTIIQNRWRCS